MTKLTRRQFVIVGGSALGVAAFGFGPAQAKSNGYEEYISKFTGGKTPVEGKLTLDMPEIAENGNTVPLTIVVDSPMTKDNYVKQVMIVADGNPSPTVGTFHFTPSLGKADASTRIRLAKTQNVHAIAEMSDGSFYSTKREVKVTIGGCGG